MESIKVQRVWAGITHQETEHSPYLGLCQAHRDFCLFLRKMLSNQQANIQKLAVAKVETSSMTTASHLKQMKLRELMANGYSVVQKFVNPVMKNWGGGGITLLRVEHEDSHDTLLEPL